MSSKKGNKIDIPNQMKNLKTNMEQLESQKKDFGERREREELDANRQKALVQQNIINRRQEENNHVLKPQVLNFYQGTDNLQGIHSLLKGPGSVMKVFEGTDFYISLEEIKKLIIMQGIPINNISDLYAELNDLMTRRIDYWVLTNRLKRELILKIILNWGHLPGSLGEKLRNEIINGQNFTYFKLKHLIRDMTQFQFQLRFCAWPHGCSMDNDHRNNENCSNCDKLFKEIHKERDNDNVSEIHKYILFQEVGTAENFTTQEIDNFSDNTFVIFEHRRQ
jgi:hypothetical protein